MSVIEIISCVVMGIAALAGVVVGIIMNVHKMKREDAMVEHGFIPVTNNATPNNAPTHSEVYANAHHVPMGLPMATPKPANVDALRTNMNNWTWDGNACQFLTPTSYPMYEQEYYYRPYHQNIDPVYPTTDPMYNCNMNPTYSYPYAYNGYSYYNSMMNVDVSPTINTRQYTNEELYQYLDDIARYMTRSDHTNCVVSNNDPNVIETSTVHSYGNY